MDERERMYRAKDVLAVNVNSNSFVLAALSTLIGANSFIHSCSFGLLA